MSTHVLTEPRGVQTRCTVGKNHAVESEVDSGVWTPILSSASPLPLEHIHSFEQVTQNKGSALGFPGGAVVENLPADAGDMGSSPGLGRSHMPRSNWAREPQLLSLHIWSLCSATREAAVVRGPRTAMKSGPRLLQLEKALAQKRRPNTAINK